MTDKMFCFQCEQTAGGKGCTGSAGVCGKTTEAALLQDELTGALVALAKSLDGKQSAPETDSMVIRAMFSTLSNVDFDCADLRAQIAAVKKAAGNVQPMDMSELWGANEDIRSLKSLILFGLRGMCAYAYHAMVLGYTDASVNAEIYKGLRAVGSDGGMDELLPEVMAVGSANLTCMEMLDRANTETFGTPAPTTVSRGVEPGPAIIISGHDLKDLKALLEQTAGKGINVYTHGEMLPAHAYPELKKYPHLRGNFGTAWQNQKKEFEGVPAAVLFTTNCIMPPTDGYKDRVFTSGTVAFPGTTHVEGEDFSPVIAKALELGGFKESTVATAGTLTTGFGHGTILSVADKVIEGVKAGAIKHFFLVAGCDGTRGSRSYFRDFVAATPADTIVLTLACGKYRFNDMDIGSIAGLPRLMDMGQCNDAYGAIKVAVALSEAFGCTVNELPLSMVLSWYEQKAVCILLTLLSLGIKGIRLGPSLPAFVSPNVLNFLVENFGIQPISTVEKDMKDLLA